MAELMDLVAEAGVPEEEQQKVARILAARLGHSRGSAPLRQAARELGDTVYNVSLLPGAGPYVEALTRLAAKALADGLRSLADALEKYAADIQAVTSHAAAHNISMGLGQEHMAARRELLAELEEAAVLASRLKFDGRDQPTALRPGRRSSGVSGGVAERFSLSGSTEGERSPAAIERAQRAARRQDPDPRRDSESFGGVPPLGPGEAPEPFDEAAERERLRPLVKKDLAQELADLTQDEVDPDKLTKEELTDRLVAELERQRQEELQAYRGGQLPAQQAGYRQLVGEPSLGDATGRGAPSAERAGALSGPPARQGVQTVTDGEAPEPIVNLERDQGTGIGAEHGGTDGHPLSPPGTGPVGGQAGSVVDRSLGKEPKNSP